MIEAIDPHPLVFSPEGSAPDLPRPADDNPKLFAPQVTTVNFLATPEYAHSDPGLRYGSWINR